MRRFIMSLLLFAGIGFAGEIILQNGKALNNGVIYNGCEDTYVIEKVSDTVNLGDSTSLSIFNTNFYTSDGC